jgi:hypothetical protein
MYRRFAAVIPIEMRKKRLQDGTWKKDVKMPRSWKEIEDNKITESQRNYAIRTGSINGITLVDVDVKDRGLEYWNAKGYDRQCNTLTTRTLNGGLHYYFKYDPEIGNDTKVMYDEERREKVGIDTKNENGLSYEGEGYEIIKDEEISEMPGEIKEEISRFRERKGKPAVRYLEITQQDIQSFEESEYYDEALIYKGLEENGTKGIYKAESIYDCKVCNREHVKNTNRTFIYKTDIGLKYYCRSRSVGVPLIIHEAYPVEALKEYTRNGLGLREIADNGFAIRRRDQHPEYIEYGVESEFLRTAMKYTHDRENECQEWDPVFRMEITTVSIHLGCKNW